jgi:hypothetical protein
MRWIFNALEGIFNPLQGEREVPHDLLQRIAEG